MVTPLPVASDAQTGKYGGNRLSSKTRACEAQNRRAALRYHPMRFKCNVARSPYGTEEAVQISQAAPSTVSSTLEYRATLAEIRFKSLLCVKFLDFAAKASNIKLTIR